MKILEFDAKYYEVKSSCESKLEKRPGEIWGYWEEEVLLWKVQLLREIKDPRESGPSEKLANLPTGVEFPNHLKDKIRYNATKQLLFYTGVMPEEEKEELLRLSKESLSLTSLRALEEKEELSKKRQYAEAIIALFQKSQSTSYIGIVVGRCYLGSYVPDKIVSSYEVPVRLIPNINRDIGIKPAYSTCFLYDLNGKETFQLTKSGSTVLGTFTLTITDALNEEGTHFYVRSPEGEQWLFKDKVYFIYNKKEDYDEEKTFLLILEHIDKERIKFERLIAKHFGTGSKAGKPCEEDYRKIPEDVRIDVWRRDEGKCKKCGSREKLEYDHMIPVSKGGSNTARNVELLCEKCNREKSANIG